MIPPSSLTPSAGTPRNTPQGNALRWGGPPRFRHQTPKPRQGAPLGTVYYVPDARRHRNALRSGRFTAFPTQTPQQRQRAPLAPDARCNPVPQLAPLGAIHFVPDVRHNPAPPLLVLRRCTCLWYCSAYDDNGSEVASAEIFAKFLVQATTYTPDQGRTRRLATLVVLAHKRMLLR